MKYQQSEKQPKSATSSEKTSTEVVKKNPDISIEDHLITNTQDFEKNGHAENSLEIGRKGAPLSWFTTGTDLVQTPQPQPRSEQVQSNNEEDSHPKSGINNPGSHVAGGLVSQRPDHGQIAEETHSQSQSLIETETPNTVPSESVKLKTLPEETFMEIETDQEKKRLEEPSSELEERVRQREQIEQDVVALEAARDALETEKLQLQNEVKEIRKAAEEFRTEGFNSFDVDSKRFVNTLQTANRREDEEIDFSDIPANLYKVEEEGFLLYSDPAVICLDC